MDKARWFKVTQGSKVVDIECRSLTDMTDNDVMVWYQLKAVTHEDNSDQ